MNAREKLIRNLCYNEKRVFSHNPDDLLLQVVGRLTVEQFVLYLEHFVDDKIREAISKIELTSHKQIDEANEYLESQENDYLDPEDFM